jgi:tungstate transport system ATP-binding protein
MTPLYELHDVTQRYGERTVLRLDRLAIAAGEFLGLLGPTGAGKSTLLRLLACLEAPAAGRLRFGDFLCNGILPPEARRQVTLVFQQPLLLHDTVENNVRLGPRLRGQDAGRRVRRVMERLELTGLAGRPAWTLSGGETALVALARALVLETPVLLLDEPTAHLDPARVALVEEVLRELQRERGVTVVWATHNLFQARRLARRVALLLDGQLVEEVDTETFFTRPADARTAAFVRGEMIY